MNFKPATVPPDLNAFGAIDSHAHLDPETFGEGVDEVLQRAWSAGLSGVVAVAASENPDVYHRTVLLAQRHARVHAVLGIHPHNASLEEVLIGPLREQLRSPGVVAVGEIGLDFHYRFSPEEMQKRVMSSQLRMAADAGLPVVLHIREAFAESLEILDSVAPLHRGVVHCFTGGPEEATAYLERGLYISIPGVVTFGPRAGRLAEAVRSIPTDRLLVETDCPYLAPHPFRGRRNEPALVAYVVRCIAEMCGVAASEVARTTAENTQRLFGLGEAA